MQRDNDSRFYLQQTQRQLQSLELRGYRVKRNFSVKPVGARSSPKAVVKKDAKSKFPFSLGWIQPVAATTSFGVSPTETEKFRVRNAEEFSVGSRAESLFGRVSGSFAFIKVRRRIPLPASNRIHVSVWEFAVDVNQSVHINSEG